MTSLANFLELPSDQVVIEVGDERITTRVLTQHLEQVACWIAENSTSQKLVMTFSCPYKTWLASLASLALGRIAVLLNPRFPEGQKQKLLKNLDSYEELSEPLLGPNRPRLAIVAKALAPHHPWLIIFTSGSSGQPKGVVHSLASLQESAQSFISFYQAKEGDRFLLSLGLFHIGGFIIAMRALESRGVLVIGGGAKTVKTDLIASEPDFVSLVPAQLHDALENPSASQTLSKSKAVLIGGASAAKPLIEKSLALTIPISLCYGSSETAAQVAALPPGQPPASAQHVGQIMPGRSVRIADDCVLVQGAGVMLGYWRTGHFEATDDQVYQSQDLGRVEGGDLFLMGRKDTVFQSGGENIAPSEIESILNHLDSGARYLVLPLADPRLTWVPQLVVVGEKPNLERVLQAMDKQLAPFKRPVKIYWDPARNLEQKLQRQSYLEKIELKQLEVLWERYG
ncbi:AMP-binding protein [Pseudobacteriovorax antillogorgiicola]|uniref:2-succinylbenzoyl-CoA synthetase n=1 Tax=Pseudobacteriovorax antillogorgiicola TaxID=1513793 RepID=A0A1Y6BAS1_9BACT|nr:AMP-binding protein [Pseudobacteriovorax antillogorgiicola]TCS58886.1 2-succinylbenzoyl-CoA synthetase [Pseudobacteriovorax antillogorgiicola]SME93589.1 2-succinylbenzoyl-CoA synthetase [Pseudobacteriovorax antillogorgiicola]